MENKIKKHSLGKLLIYATPSDKIRHGERSIFRRFFPKSAYVHIIQDAKMEGILNASAYNTHFGFSNNESIQSFNVEADNSKLTMCVELVDKKEKLESFCLRHKNYLKGKVVIFKEVEFWDID
jgi:PII-like signaling protein